MSAGSEKAEEKVFTPGFIVAVLIYVLANAYLNQTVSWLTTWWLWHQIIPPSIFTSILVLYVLERISGRHLNRKQVMLFLFVMITGQGRGVLSWVLNKPAWNVPQTIGTGSITYGLWHLIAPGVSPVTSPYMAKHWYAFPQNPSDISWAWNGLPKGQALPWGDYMVPIIWWTTTMLLSAGLGIFLAQILYKPALEVEKLPYPAITPSATLFDWYWGKEGEEKKIGGKMFSIFENRLFWIFVVIGLLITLPDILVYVIAGFPSGIYYGQYFFNLAPWLSSIFPGGSFYFYFYFYRLAWYIFMPLDTLLTAFIFSVFIYWLYPPIAIGAGWMPLIPAAHNEYNAWTYGVTTGPFRHKLFTNYGIVIAIALWFLYAHRRHFVDTFKAAFLKTAPSEKEGDLSFRFLWTGFLLFLVIYIVWTAIWGAVILSILAGVVFWFFYYVGGTVGFGRATWMGDVHDPGYWIMPYIYDAGVAQGAFGPSASQAKFDTYFVLRAGGIPGANYYTNQTDFQVGGILGSYKLLGERGIKRADIFKTQWTAWILAIPIGIITFIWFINTWGHNNLSIVIYGGWDAGTNSALLQTNYVLGGGLHWQWLGIGAVTGIIIYILRMKFPWFFLDPVGFIFAEGWTAIIIEAGLCWTIKYLAIKFGGPKAYEKYVLPAAVGYLAGMGVTGTLTALFVGFPASLRRLMGG